MPLGDQIKIFTKNWAVIADSFAATRREETYRHLAVLEQERAKRLFPGLIFPERSSLGPQLTTCGSSLAAYNLVPDDDATYTLLPGMIVVVMIATVVAAANGNAHGAKDGVNLGRRRKSC